MTVVAFLAPKLSLRGTEVAIYDYAYYNQTLLKNKSIIITCPYLQVQHFFDVDQQMYDKFSDTFPMHYFNYGQYNEIADILLSQGVTHLYVIKYGLPDYPDFPGVKVLNHCVFVCNYPHGDVYSVVSNYLNVAHGTHWPVVPHMINLPAVSGDLRDELGIPKDAIVFGRYGGKESFDISYVHEAIKEVLETNDNIYFLFMNTYVFYDHQRIIYLPGTYDMIYKRLFINTTDAMLHARTRGETFGLACGEFAICGKPVITCGSTPERNHLDILADKAIIYNNQTELSEILKTYKPHERYAYEAYLPEKVMQIFHDVYLQ